MTAFARTPSASSKWSLTRTSREEKQRIIINSGANTTSGMWLIQLLALSAKAADWEAAAAASTISTDAALTVAIGGHYLPESAGTGSIPGPDIWKRAFSILLWNSLAQTQSKKNPPSHVLHFPLKKQKQTLGECMEFTGLSVDIHTWRKQPCFQKVALNISKTQTNDVPWKPSGFKSFLMSAKDRHSF